MSMTENEILSRIAGQPGQGESFWVLSDHCRFKISSQETGGALAVVELTAFPQNGPPPHIHHREDEAFYVLDRTFSVLLGSQSLEARMGAFSERVKNLSALSGLAYKNIGAILSFLTAPKKVFANNSRHLRSYVLRLRLSGVRRGSIMIRSRQPK
jgi:hypothetical protein